jgi:4'-phosphopantetheinyl transferase
MHDPSYPSAEFEIRVMRVELGTAGRDAARAALGRILADCLGIAEPPPLTRDEGGKPRLAADPAQLSFNLSHSGALALIAIAPGPVEVGVDVERLRPRRDPARLAARWLSAADAVVVAGASEEERQATFHAAWTRHEARVKCTGAGLSGPPPGDEVVARQLEVGPGYAAAVAFDRTALPGREPRIVLHPAGWEVLRRGDGELAEETQAS